MSQFKRVALVFPPQWDPRHPPLAPAVIAGHLLDLGVETRVFDLNLALYRHLLAGVQADTSASLAARQLLDPSIFADLHRYDASSRTLEDAFRHAFDARGQFQLGWDHLTANLLIDSTTVWQQLLANEISPPHHQWLALQAERLIGWKPDIVGISIISDSQIAIGLYLIGLLCRIAPALPIMIGGDAVFYRRSLLPAIGALHARVRFVVGGDAEPFLSALLSSSDKDLYTNQIGQNPTSECPASRFRRHDFLKPSRPAWHLMPLADYLTPHLVIPIETARGCPWGQCCFCIHPGRSPDGRAGYRRKPLEFVRQEVQQAGDLGINRLFFVDEALSERRIRDISQMLLGLSTPVSWIAYARFDPPRQPDLWRLARRAGCRKLFLGLETGSDRLLTLWKKGTRAAEIAPMLQAISEAGIAVHLFLMTGFPGETEEDRELTLDVLRRSLPFVDPFGFSYDLFSLQAELETPLFEHPERFGCRIEQDDRQRDLAYQHRLIPSPSTSSLLDYADRLQAVIENTLQRLPGLRRLRLSQDAHHLLFLEHRR